MKIQMVLTSFILSLFLGQNSFAESVQKEYGVSGMVCSFCSQGIEKKFKQQSAVKEVSVSLKDKKLLLTFKDNQSLTDDEVQKILESAGYKMTAKTQ